MEKMEQSEIIETELNLLSEGTRFNGKLELSGPARIHGTVQGEIEGKPGSLIIIGETGVIEGDLRGDVIMIDGFVQGNVRALSRCVISATGRLIGNVTAPQFAVEFGAYFEGKSKTDGKPKTQETPESEPSHVPA